MNDPLDRLRSTLDATQLSGAVDARALSRRATLRRWRQATLAGAAAVGVVAVALGGPGGPQRLGITTPPSVSAAPTGTPVAEPEPGGTPDPALSPSPGSTQDAGPEPDASWPAATAGPRESGGASGPEPTRGPAGREPAAGTYYWSGDYGAAPFFGRQMRRGDMPRFCEHPASGDPAVRMVGRFCLMGGIHHTDYSGGDYRAELGVCVAQGDEPVTLAYPTEQETELRIDADDGTTPVYTWSRHQSFAPTPRRETLGLRDCVFYLWHLYLVDDTGRPLVPGRRYTMHLTFVAGDPRLAGFVAESSFDGPP